MNKRIAKKRQKRWQEQALRPQTQPPLRPAQKTAAAPAQPDTPALKETASAAPDGPATEPAGKKPLPAGRRPEEPVAAEEPASAEVAAPAEEPASAETPPGPAAKKEMLFSRRWLLFFVLTAYWEILYKILTAQRITVDSAVFMLLFCLLAACVLTLLTGLFRPKGNYRTALALLILLCLAYCSQYIYYSVFKTPMLVYSILQAGKVAEFAGTAGNLIFAHFWQLLLFVLPGAALCRLLAVRRLPRMQRKQAMGCLGLGAALYGAFLLILAGSGSHANSPYHLYYNEDSPLLNQREFGVLAAMLIDTRRTAFGFSPKDTAYTLSSPDMEDVLEGEGLLPEEEGEDTPPEEKAYAPNVLDIDFTALDAGGDGAIQDMNQYFSQVTPTLQNEYTGMFAGCNLIYIVAESFSQYLLNPEWCPTLYRLATEGWQFTNFYTPLWNVSTSDGEYVACTGLIPKSGCWSFSSSAQNALPFCLGHQFAAQGYRTPQAYHDHTYTYYDRDRSHPNMGYDYHGLGNGLDVTPGWPESDLEMMEKTVGEYIWQDQFHVYYLTVSGHLEYNFSGNKQARRHKEETADLPYSEAARAYIACNLELEQAMSYLLQRLEAAGRLKDTVIVLSADHYPYGLPKDSIDELAGHTVEENFELYRNGLILWKAGLPHQEIDRPACSLDVLPTVSNLFGLPYDSRLLMGTDIFSDAPPLIIFNNRSWITDMAAYNALTQQVDGPVSQAYVDSVNHIVANKIYYSAQILDKDYYRYLFGKSQIELE
ncbi:MAG: sulfatase-like hydrolase/transferase [Firmicutes bacterium]|nr:sulfatase-like hydrolase/transferase [Bacillota bacterium]